MVFSINGKEKDSFVWLLDKALLTVQEYADNHGEDIDGMAENVRLAKLVTDIDWSEFVDMDTILTAAQDIQQLYHSIHHPVWELVSNYTGEIFTLVGEPGQGAWDAMEKQGFSPDVWEVHQQLE